MSNWVLWGLLILGGIVYVISNTGQKDLNHISGQLDDIQETLKKIASHLESQSFR